MFTDTAPEHTDTAPEHTRTRQHETEHAYRAPHTHNLFRAFQRPARGWGLSPVHGISSMRLACQQCTLVTGVCAGGGGVDNRALFKYMEWNSGFYRTIFSFYF